MLETIPLHGIHGSIPEVQSLNAFVSPYLSKNGHFSQAAKAEKRPLFPRLKSRGPIEALPSWA